MKYPMLTSQETLEESLYGLLKYVEDRRYNGYDPYDALNSPLLRLVTRPSRYARIGVTQAIKLIPVNLRPLLGVKSGRNPKGMGLFLSAYIKLYRATGNKRYLTPIEVIGTWLKEHLSSGYSGCCWGYNFDWQSRAFYVPMGTPTIVNTSVIGHAFLDLYESLNESSALTVARSSCDFIMNDLNVRKDSTGICFSYTPLDNLTVHNANYLGASLLARVGALTEDQTLIQTAVKAYAFGNSHQRSDGSWPYAETAYQSWIDSYHTGFNLEALQIYAHYVDPNHFIQTIEKGFQFYIDHSFLEDGTPKYYHNKVSPIDIHSAAQALITLTHFQHASPRSGEILNRVLSWTLRHMQDRKGYFYFRKGSFWVNKTPHMRWAQSWMLYALATVLEEFNLAH